VDGVPAGGNSGGWYTPLMLHVLPLALALMEGGGGRPRRDAGAASMRPPDAAADTVTTGLGSVRQMADRCMSASASAAQADALPLPLNVTATPGAAEYDTYCNDVAGVPTM